MRPIKIVFETDEEYQDFQKWVDSEKSNSPEHQRMRELIKENRQLRKKDEK